MLDQESRYLLKRPSEERGSLLAEASNRLSQLNPNETSRSKLFALDSKRGLWLPNGASDFKGDEEYDSHGRPRRVNIMTVADYLSHDILAADRFFQPESTRTYPLFPHQRMMLQEMMRRQFLYVQIMRGGAKSSTFARGFIDYALMVPGTPIILTAPTFRQSLLIFDEIIKLLEMNKKNESAAFNINVEIKGDVRRGTMEAIIRFHNGSVIKAVPMGDGSKIRGLRGGVLFVDEAYQITEEMYESHLRPFVGVKQGGRDSKIIMTTTSWYQDCFMYKRLMQIAAEVKAGNEQYGILDFTIEDLVESGFPLSQAVWRDAQKHGNPVTYLMTYYNIWPSSQARWYEQKALDDALSSRHGVKIELAREKATDATYFGVVDLAASEKGDSTCLMVAKVKDGTARWVWGKKAKGWNNHRRAWETHELIRKFKPAFVIYDSHGAIGTDFRTDMSMDTLVVRWDDESTEIKSVTPVIAHDAMNRRGERLLIPVSVKDDAVITALTGDKNGDIEGEDGLNNLLHTKTRSLLWEGKYLGPGIDVLPEIDETKASKIDYNGSEQEALDVVREAFAQLGKISLDKDIDGNQKTTKNGKLVFKKKSGASVDDGAYCLIYGSIGFMRLDGYDGSNGPRTQGRVAAMHPNGPGSGVPEYGNVQKLSFA
jgi:hypothetical protein